MLALAENLDAVDEDVLYARGVLMRVGIRRVVGNGLGVKDYHVRKIPFAKEAALSQTEVGRWEACQPPDCFG